MPDSRTVEIDLDQVEAEIAELEPVHDAITLRLERLRIVRDYLIERASESEPDPPLA